MELKQTIEINAPREKVFYYLTDEEKAKVWSMGLQERVYPAGFDRENPVGQPYIQRIKEGGRIAEYTATILERKAPELLRIQMAGKAFTMVMAYQLVESNGKTTLESVATTVSSSRFLKILMTLFAGFTKRLARKQLESLKREVENNT